MKRRLHTHLERFRLKHPDGALVDAADGWTLQDDDVAQTLIEHRAPPILFNHVTSERIMDDLAKAGILERVRRLGYHAIRPEFSGQDAFETRFCLLAEHPDIAGPCILVDMRTRQAQMNVRCPFTDEDLNVRAVILDWLSMEDVSKSLRTGRIALPGQQHPGLGMFRRAYQLTLSYLRETDFDAVVNVPEYFHNAVLYSRDFKFFLPHWQGRFEALKRDLLPKGLARVSHALTGTFEQKVEEVEQSRVVHWTPAEQVLPLSHEMRAYFHDIRYLRAVEEERNSRHYRLAT